jgi:hypothetical protein
MEKGVRNNPDSWQMHFETGFVQYVCARDYAAASRHFRRAAELPGAPESAQRFAAFVTARAGDPRAALYLWSEFARRTTNGEMRRKALEQVERLEMEMKGGAGNGGDSH